MKIKFYCDSGANIQSKREEIVDIEDWCLTAEDWQSMSEDDKFDLVKDWAYSNGLEIGYEELG